MAKQSKEKEPKLLTANQAFNVIGGNKRLAAFVGKVYKGTKAFSEWKQIFAKDNIR